MTGRFTIAGYSTVEFGVPCDVAVIHGCSITRAAESESLQSARRVKRDNPDAIVVLAGCTAELSKGVLPYNTADLIVGQSDKLTIPDILHSLHPHRFPAPPSHSDLASPHFETKRAFIKIQDGCNFHCSYCIVPAARGQPRSRTLSDIVREAQQAASIGFQEIILTGANIGLYQSNGDTLANLLHAIDAIPEIGRFRLGSVELTTAEHIVADFMAKSSKLCQFLHLPLQSGDDRILASMGRRYTATTFRNVVSRIVSRLPTIGLGTDVIVGFPGEDIQAFDHTVQLINDFPFSNIHVFPYSRRPGTRADTMPNQIHDAVKRERVQILVDIAKAKRAKFAHSFIGKTASILVEKADTIGSAWGWTAEYLDAKVSTLNAKVGDLISFTVEGTSKSTLLGRQSSSP